MPDHHKIYTGILACIIVVLGSLIGITHFWTKRSHTELAIDHPQIDNHNFILPDEIGYQKAKQLLAHNKIIQAIKSLPNTSTTDKKNQAILRSYLAEQEIQKDTLTGRQQARQYTQQANEILASINDNESLKMQEQNQTIILTTCIVESQAIVQHLTNIVDQQKETQSTIKQIDNMLAKRDLPPSCKTQLKKNIQSNQEAISSWIQNTQAKNISQKETNLKLTETVACDINNIP